VRSEFAIIGPGPLHTPFFSLPIEKLHDRFSLDIEIPLRSRLVWEYRFSRDSGFSARPFV
jgi:hypothetical protein